MQQWIKKWIDNEKGSLPLTLIVIMLVMGIVASITVINLSDQSGINEEKKVIQGSLNDESIMEIIYFGIASRLDQKYYDVANDTIFTPTEFSDMQNDIATRLQTEYAQYLGGKVTLDTLQFDEAGFTAHDLCSNINTCTFNLHFETTVTYPDGTNKGIKLTLTNLQWNNVADETNPVYQISTLHSRWRFEIAN